MKKIIGKHGLLILKGGKILTPHLVIKDTIKKALYCILYAPAAAVHLGCTEGVGAVGPREQERPDAPTHIWTIAHYFPSPSWLQNSF